MKQWIAAVFFIGLLHGVILFAPSLLTLDEAKTLVAQAPNAKMEGVKVEIKLHSPSLYTEKNKKFLKQASLPLASAGGATSKAKSIGKLSPPYPRISRRLGEEGTIKIVCTVHEDGSISNIRIISSTGYKRLDDNSVEFLKKTKFIPAYLRGTAIKSEHNLTISYTLHQD